jgi:copper chaperone
METKFKTTIKCAGCIAKVTPFLNEAVGDSQWQVDINDPAKILTINSEKAPREVIEAVEKAGFKAEPIQK